MTLVKNEKRQELLMGLFGLLLGVGLIFGMRASPQSPERFLFKAIPPPAHVELFSFGYRETMADVFWIRVLQDIDVCETAPEGRAGGTEERGIEASCRRGWVFHMIDAISTLAPAWRLPYFIGGLLLSVMVDDREGAALIFEKGMKQFPNDYNLHYTAAYHYIYEVKNPKRAAEALLVAAANGGPSWFYALAGKLYTEAGQALVAKQVLENALKDEHNQVAAQRIKKRLKEADAVLAKESSQKELQTPAGK